MRINGLLQDYIYRYPYSKPNVYPSNANPYLLIVFALRGLPVSICFIPIEITCMFNNNPPVLV